MEEYKPKLIVCGNVTPEPFSLQDGWLAGKKGTGLAKWTSVYYTNIEKFLSLLEKCPNAEFFLVRIFLYSD